MENWEQYALKLELKYCERCGGLWLRPKGSDLSFCAGCAKALAGLVAVWPRAGQSNSTRRTGKTPEPQGTFWGEGGNA
jgi:hypothetical protein